MNGRQSKTVRVPHSSPNWATGPIGRATLALLIVLLLGLVFNANGTFFKASTHRDTLRQVSVYGILACGMTLVIISAGIDLSVGSVLALVAVIVSLLLMHWHWSAWLSVPAALLVGAACGAASGTVTAWLRVQPFIATLAMMAFARGLAKYVSGGMKISASVLAPDGTYEIVPIPAVFEIIDGPLWSGSHGPLIDAINPSVVTVVFLSCAGLAWLALSRHRWGRQLYAIGGNEEAARLSGVPVIRAKTLAYVAAGLLSAVAGICQAAQEQQGDPQTGNGYELTAIAMVVIGGTNLMGGRGGIGLTLLGVLTIGYLEKILSINAVPEWGRLMLTGTIIIVAVVAQRTRQT